MHLTPPAVRRLAGILEPDIAGRAALRSILQLATEWSSRFPDDHDLATSEKSKATGRHRGTMGVQLKDAGKLARDNDARSGASSKLLETRTRDYTGTVNEERRPSKGTQSAGS
jgi:hypothetical protein